MGKLLLGSIIVASLAIGGPAGAADLAPLKAPPLPPPSVWSWSGLYIGLNGGAGWGHTSHTATLRITGLGAAPAGSTGDFNVDGGLFGGTVGYNYQIGQWVLGVESDLDGADIKGTFRNTLIFGGAPLGGLALPAVTIPFTLTSQLKWLDTTRLRVGWAMDRTLLYATGGAAFGGVTTTASTSIAALGVGLTATLADTQTRFGWTGGAGIEHYFTSNLSGKIEYLYVDLGSQTQLLIDNVKFNTHIVRAGVNWKLN